MEKNEKINEILQKIYPFINKNKKIDKKLFQNRLKELNPNNLLSEMYLEESFYFLIEDLCLLLEIAYYIPIFKEGVFEFGNGLNTLLINKNIAWDTVSKEKLKGLIWGVSRCLI